MKLGFSIFRQLFMKNTPPLTRTCLVCGLEKPLAAFLQITGTQGTIYGNICSSCRSTTAKDKIIPQADNDEDQSGSSGLKIDSKRKLQTEIEQKKERKKLTDDTREEKKKTDELSLEKIDRLEKKEQAEKDHRKTYIEAKKKQSFLGERKKPVDTQKIQRQKNFIADHQQAIEAQKLEDATEHEQKLTGIDTTQMYLDPQFGEIKFQSAVFRRFKDWLGESAHFRMMERLHGKMDKPAAAEKTPATKDPLVDFVEKTEKGTTRRR